MAVPVLVEQIAVTEPVMKEIPRNCHIVLTVFYQGVCIILAKPTNRLDAVGNLGLAQTLLSQMSQLFLHAADLSLLQQPGQQEQAG